MKKAILFTVLVFLGLQVLAQSGKYWIQFSNKDNSPYSVSSPLAFLSQRAIDRRTSQGIPVTVQDLPVNPAYLAAVSATGATLLNPSKWLNGTTVLVSGPAILNQILGLPFVSEAVYVAPSSKGNGSISPKWEQFEKMNPFAQHPPVPGSVKHAAVFDYGSSYNQIHMLNGDLLHELGFRGQGMLIAVLDAGFFEVDINNAFDTLWDHNQILGTHDFVDGGNVFDDNSHGTYVLSIMGGNIPGQLIGTAPKAHYWLLRSEDTNGEYLIEEYNWVSAAEFADSVGADIINSSLGYTVFDDPAMDHSYEDLDGLTAPGSRGAAIAAAKGILVCNSAGNSGGSAWEHIGVPADADSIVSVGAVNDQGNYASFSSTGPTPDGRIKPDLSTQGEGTWVAGSWGVFPGNGTSFSSPVLAGMAACLWQANTALTNFQVIQAMKQSASQFNNPDNFLGWGIPDFQMALMILSEQNYPNLDEGNSPKIFPNPFSDVLRIGFTLNDSQQVSIEVFDITGSKVYDSGRIQLNPGQEMYSLGEAATWAHGSYILRVTTSDKVYTQKLTRIK